MQHVRPRLTHEQWISLIQEQQVGSSSIEAFCADRKLAVHSFYYHRKKMVEADAPGGFVQVVAEDAGVRIRRSGAPWAIEVDPGFDARTLRRVIEVLGS